MNTCLLFVVCLFLCYFTCVLCVERIKFSTASFGGNQFGDSFPISVATLGQPASINFDSNGDLIITDSVIRKVSNGVIDVIAGSYKKQEYGGDGGQAVRATFRNPVQTSFDSMGNLFIVARGENRIRVIYSSSGTVGTVAGTGSNIYNGDNILATSANLHNPNCVAVFNGEIYITEDYSRIRRVLKNGTIETIVGGDEFGFEGDGGPANLAVINYPTSIAFAANGDFYFVDRLNYRIRKVSRSSGTITTVAGNGSPGYEGNGGKALSASIIVEYLVIGPSGNIYFSGGTVIRMLNVITGNISLIAGVPLMADYNGDGIPATSAYITPGSLAFSPNGDLYFIDKKRIRFISSSTGLISTLIGSDKDFTGDGYLAVKSYISEPRDAVSTPKGEIFILDKCVIRKIDTKGIISTVGGSGNCVPFGEEDTPALLANMNPIGISYSSRYAAIFINENSALLKLSIDTGIISRVAGLVGYSSGDDGGLATQAVFASVTDLFVSPNSDELYVVDSSSFVIRLVNSNGTISTAIGKTGMPNFNGDNIKVNNATLSPTDGLISKKGEMYIIANNRIRKVGLNGKITTIAGNGSDETQIGNGGPAFNATLVRPISLVLSPNEDCLFVWDNNVVRMINFTTGIISKYVNEELWGNFAVSPISGDLYYIVEGCTIKVLNSITGNTSVFAGTGKCSSNEPVNNAIISKSYEFNFPSNLQFSKEGLLYLVDNGVLCSINQNRTLSTIYKSESGFTLTYTLAANGDIYFSESNTVVKRIRKGKVSAVAGGRGEGAIATNALVSPCSVVVSEKSGEIYIQDSTARIEKIDTSQHIYVIGGTGESGYNGNGLLATSSQIGAKLSNGNMDILDNGELIFADTKNQRIRKISNNGTIIDIIKFNETNSPVSVTTLGDEIYCSISTSIVRIVNGVVETIMEGDFFQSIQKDSNGRLVVTALDEHQVFVATPYCENGLTLTENNQRCAVGCYGEVGSAACSGSIHGSCIDVDTCQCSQSYIGESCQYVKLSVASLEFNVTEVIIGSSPASVTLTLQYPEYLSYSNRTLVGNFYFKLNNTVQTIQSVISKSISVLDIPSFEQAGTLTCHVELTVESTLITKISSSNSLQMLRKDATNVGLTGGEIAATVVVPVAIIGICLIFTFILIGLMVVWSKKKQGDQTKDIELRSQI